MRSVPVPSVTPCPHCQEPKLPHRVCGACGFYRDREVIALKYHADLSHAEIAEVLGVSASNAGTLLHRAMTKLREAVDA